MCVMLCHGYAPSTELTVAWLVAHERALPFAESAAAGSEAGRRHQFSWDDCDRLRSASPVVVSASCSTAVSHSAGGGEQLGLYSALRRHGTRALVAPRWDIPADATLPVFADAIERILRDGEPPAAAVRAASLAAARWLPSWLAYAPAVASGWLTSGTDHERRHPVDGR
jgi:CHAT domain-containing protein